MAAAAVAIVIVATQNDTQREPPGRATESTAAPSAPPGLSTTPGEALTGTVASGGSTTIPFTVDAGTVSYFAAAPDCSATGLQWVVEDSAGAQIKGAAVICGDIGRVEFAAAGDYRVRVYSDGTGGSSEFSVSRKDSRPDRILAISSGQSIDGNIDLPGAQDIYEFDAAADTVAYFASGDCAASGPQWVVEDAAGASASSGSVICDDIGRVDFPTAGRYRIRVYSAAGTTGAYQVQWKPSRQDQTFAIASGQTVNGDIDLPGARDLYAFDVTAAAVAYFAAAPDCTQDDRYWVIEDSAGAVVSATSGICEDIGRVAFAAAGQFRVRVESADGATGRYALTWRTSRPDKQQDLVIGTTSGSIDAPGSRDNWTFSADQGESVTLTADASCDSTDLLWVVLASDGTAITPPSSMCDDIGTVTVPTAGEYRIVVSADGPATDDYVFHTANG